jgi:hypothetical protein
VRSSYLVYIAHILRDSKGRSSYPKQRANPLLIESHDRFAVNDGHWSTLVAHVEQLFQCRLVGAHVLVNEIDAFLRKKLSLFVAGPSAGLTINNDHFCHLYYPPIRLGLDTTISSNDSERSRQTVRPEPAGSRFDPAGIRSPCAGRRPR